MSIEYNNSSVMNNLADMYEKQGKHKEAENYFLMGVKYENSNAMNGLVGMYEKQNKYEEAEKYYLMSIKYENLYAMNNLGIMYENQKKYDQAENYYLMAISYQYKLSLDNLVTLYNNNLKLYNVLINKKIHELKKIREIIIYENKIRFLSKYDSCPICLEDNIQVIPLECSHFYCLKCYTIVKNKCSICRM